MQLLTLWNNKVDLIVTHVRDGNMKVVPNMSSTAKDQARAHRLHALKSLESSLENTALVRVSYETDDFCKFKSIGAAGSSALCNDLTAPYLDGILTQDTNTGLFLPLADCLGLVLYAPNEHALMMVHCGRHTLLQQGAAQAVEFLIKNTQAVASGIHAWLSPCAGKGNYPLFEAENKGLQEYAIEQLCSTGVLKSHISCSPEDTTCSPEYFSHSKGDTQSRFAIAAKMSG